MNIRISLLFKLLILFIPSDVMASELMNIDQGAAKTISLKRDIATVFVANPAVGDYKVVDDNKVVVYGVAEGATSVIVYDRNGNEIENIELVVNKSLRLLKQVLIARYPEEDVSLSNVGDQVVIDGIVTSEEIKNNIYRLVGEMLQKENTRNVFSTAISGSGSDNELAYTASYEYKQVINNLKVLTTNQINVKLTVAEVSTSFLSDLGVSYGDEGGPQGRFVNKLLDFSAQDIVAIISANSNDSLGQVLAEPNLSVISGEQASFLVGGEIPVAVQSEDGITVDYKEYGVKLSMVAKVTDSDNIRLSLFPEVSSIDQESATTIGALNAPSIRTRRAQTTVQLKDGQSFVLAGLLTREEREAVSKVPLLGDIPVIGALFSRTTTNYAKTELIIIATVNLVDPVEPESLKIPHFKRTSELERLLNVDLSDIDDEELGETISAGGFN